MTIGKTLVKQQYLLHMPSQLGELWSTADQRSVGEFGALSKFQLVSCLRIVTAPTSVDGGQPNFALCLTISWAATLCIHFWGLLPCNGILPGGRFILRPRLAFSYIGSVTARHSSTAACDKGGN